MKSTTRKESNLKAMMASSRATHAFKVETSIMEITEEITHMMEERGINKTQLAHHIGVSPAYITKILRGTSNFTLDSMVKIATALDCKYRCHLQKEENTCHWMDFSIEEPARPFVFDANQFTPVKLGNNRNHEPQPLLA